ncbi:MAG: nucleotidyl transferase AbiEii/AbiGii toxin family protein [Spirochaetales bacterium]|uniref:Nucleotidyl transferase AbiEii/AbiGii toxin family protein n=1 Tax=Candidatus Thalassospirochaeta sargassi TaxID=3119039 RepID=A0AAJ1IF22_9SPIO|nr:nucleotidyl transferase AbiEii/AbiGii toxin family protein [Spirochaetales bacterium]
MKDAAKQLFDDYLSKNNGSADMALAETIQAITLLGLSRTDFFSRAAFYGGTALRILHNLNRFSEDLDFSLLQPEKGEFRLDSYFGPLVEELESFGFKVDVSLKNKKIITPIESAFIKADTRVHVINAGAPESISSVIHRNAVSKIELEIDTNPAEGADYDVVFIDEPIPFSVRTYSMPALFAGEMDAVLSRGWSKRVKGRDWYDFAFFVRKKTPLLLPHLEARLRQKNFYTADEPLRETVFLELLKERINTVDFEAAKQDVRPFINDPREIEIWSPEYFLHVMNNIIYA